MKKAYYYFFYQLYKFWEYVSYPKIWSDFKASLSIIILQICSIVSILIYYKIFIDYNINIIGKQIQWVVGVMILVLIDYMIFHYKNQWRNIVYEYDKLPNKKNTIGSWIVIIIVLLILSNLIFSFYLYYQK